MRSSGPFLCGRGARGPALDLDAGNLPKPPGLQAGITNLTTTITVRPCVTDAKTDPQYQITLEGSASPDILFMYLINIASKAACD